MVKSVVGEETRLQIAEERLFKSTNLAQVGLLVGKLSSDLDRGYIYDLIPTPLTDDGKNPCSIPSSDKKKGAKGRSTAESVAPLIVDVDWVAEHARQVSRLLLGGMHVVGIFIWTSESSFKASTLVLCQTVKEVAQASPIRSNNLTERLIIHASYSPRRWTCRNCEITSMNVSTSLRPCDFKWGKLLGSLQVFRCIYEFDLRLPMSSDPKSETFRNALREAISDQSKELMSCTQALINGKLVHEDQQCISGALNQVELLLPFMNKVPPFDEEIFGLTLFTGVVCAAAYLGPKETAFEAISELKGDIINSLHSRLDILCEDTSQADASVDGVDAQDIFALHKSSGALHFPRRVLVPWLGNVFICDYLQPSETVEALGTHCVEMMSMDSPIISPSVAEVEKEASPPSIKSFRDAALGRCGPVPQSSPQSETCSKPAALGLRTDSGSRYLLLSVAALLIAIFVGWIMSIMAIH